jgi:DNA-binding transcriptional ArsR family regulator
MEEESSSKLPLNSKEVPKDQLGDIRETEECMENGIYLLQDPTRRELLKFYQYPNAMCAARSKFQKSYRAILRHTQILNGAGLIQKLPKPEGKKVQLYIITELGRKCLMAIGEIQQ